MYKIVLTKKAKKQLKNINKELAKRIDSTLKRIRIRPFNFIKKLTNIPLYSIRVGDYRVILDIKKKELIILILEVGHRRNIYKSIK